jgi:hypothetical protein
MTSTPSPQEFLAQPYDPDEDTEPDESQAVPDLQFPPASYPLDIQWATNGDFDPLADIAASLRTIAGLSVAHVEEETQAVRLEQELAGLEVYASTMQEQLEHIAAIIKPSTSKLAKQIRAVLEPPAPIEPKGDPEPDAHAGGTGQPADDASVEDWRQFAQTMAGDAHDWSELNRSQIRTALGIAQPTPSTDG